MKPISILRTLLPWLCFALLFWPPPANADALDFLSSAPYRIEFLGDMEPGVRDVLKAVSDTFALQHHTPSTPQMLKRRADMDVPKMLRALRSEGYYDAQVAVDVDPDAALPVVTFHVHTGPAYILAAVHFDWSDAEDSLGFILPGAADLNLIIGARARAPIIAQGTAKLHTYLREHGRPFPEVKLGEVLVDHTDRSVTVNYFFNPGPKAFFGPVKITGEEKVRQAYILEKLPWTEGQLFQASLLNLLRSSLLQDGLFALVDVSHQDALGKDRALQIHIAVAERNPRTVKAGLTYETDIGFGSALNWENRNLYGQGEQLRTELMLAEIKQRFSSEYDIPDFFSEEQSLKLSGFIGQDDTGAYDSKGGAVGIKLFRQLNSAWTASLGANYRITKTTQLDLTQTHGLFSIPGELAWDTRNDVLNPTRGWRIFFKAEPFLDTLGLDTWFFKLFSGVSMHVPILSEDRLTLAARGGLGSVMGEASRNLPPDKRFYSGGGGSIRGYAYQSIGPEEDGNVVGGRSQVETSLELRLRMENNFGLVAFLDGGQIFTKSHLELKDDFFWGVGLGLHYYTDFAPIRLDVAFPLNRREKDDAFQVYVSIGQAF